MAFYQKTTLPSGLRVVTEEIPHVRSASVGVWIGAGSCWENPGNMGISHFIEHMLFKGTQIRSARQIAQAIDGRGGTLNAFTSKEHTCFYAKVLDEHLAVAIEVLADMIQHSVFSPVEMEKEKGVIIEEIKMYEDVPDDLVHDLFASAMWADHALGRPIVGTAETVQSFSRDRVLAYLGTHYTSENMVVAVAGHVQHDAVVEHVARLFGDLRGGEPATRLWPAPPAGAEPTAIIRAKETEQTHLVLGMKGLAQEHEELYTLHLINTVLGGGTSSRLFQEIREERGLAYSVYSYQSSFRDTGNFAVYAGVSPSALPQVLDLVETELSNMGSHGITAEELVEAKEQLKGQIMLGLESTSGRMSRLGRGELSQGWVSSPDEIIARIDAVEPSAAAALAKRLFLEEPRVLAVVGTGSEAVDYAAHGLKEVKHG